VHTAYLVVTFIAIAFDGFSGGAALAHFPPIMPPMAAAGVPVSWLRFPIGTLKTLGALGLVVGLWLPAIGIAAAAGLVLFFVCAVYTHVLARDITGQMYFGGFMLCLNCAALAVAIMDNPGLL
jgi:DoxX-like family